MTLKEKLEKSDFKIALLLGIIISAVVLHQPYFQSPLHPDAMKEMEFANCHPSLKLLETFCELEKIKIPKGTTLAELNKLTRELVDKVAARKMTVNLHDKDISKSIVLLPGKTKDKPLCFCYKHGFASYDVAKRRPTPRKQLELLGIKDKEILLKALDEE